MPPFALLDDCQATASQPSSRLYTGWVGECRCDDPSDLDRVWAEAEGAMRAGRHLVVLADYEWGARLQRAGDSGLTAGEQGALRLLLFASRHDLSHPEVDAWLAAREAEALAAGLHQGAVTMPPADLANWHEVTRHAAEYKGILCDFHANPADPGPLPPPAPAGLFAVRPSQGPDAFSAALDRIHDLILAGETYQVNYSYRLDFQAFGSPFSLYRRLRARQPVPYGALLALPPATADAEPTWVLSCSPELFLRHHGGLLQARPMKGTAPRGTALARDAALARQLGANAKTRAENLMIVDLLRNDLGRLARTGGVRVPALFELEAHPSLWQMTSTIEADLPSAVSFPEVLRATFPCGSITGAPKLRTMHWIRHLETRPRGLYTGAIGWIDAPIASAPKASAAAGFPEDEPQRGPDLVKDRAPGGSLNEMRVGLGDDAPAEAPQGPGPSERSATACGDFCLSVAIRTLTLGPPAVADSPLTPRPGTLGIGAGIVNDSQAADEYAECQLKAWFLTALDPGFSLFETLYATRSAGIRHRERHLARLGRSANTLGFHLPLASIRQALTEARLSLPPGHPWRLKLEVRHGGAFTLTRAPLDPLPPGPVCLLLAPEPMDGADPLLGHKTSRRARYDAAIAAANRLGAFDLLFRNRQGLLTEGGRTNLFLHLDGRWLTPHLAAGVLPGVMRGLILADPAWAAREAALTLADLRRADRIMVCNALRGPVDARLVE